MTIHRFLQKKSLCFSWEDDFLSHIGWTVVGIKDFYLWACPIMGSPYICFANKNELARQVWGLLYFILTLVEYDHEELSQ